ncbi:MAG: glycoside hydrolase family 2 protein [Mycobacterium leprae]
MTQPRSEYPRPQFVRADWLNLNGTWEFAFDDENLGERKRWWAGNRALERTITVPYAFQTPLSGVGDPSLHDVVWYRRLFTVPAEWAGRDLLLHFGAVDYRAKVWVNGQLVATHEGGHTPFAADITAVATKGENVVVVRAEDPSLDMTIPRGKQYWKAKSEGIFYTRTTGIWQTVWLEPVAPTRLDRVRLTPDLDTVSLDARFYIEGFKPGLKVQMTVRFEGELVAEESFLAAEPRFERSVGLPDPEQRYTRLWWPWRPKLHDVTLKLIAPDGTVLDTVESYFGLRKISVDGGKVLLNNRPFYQKLVLDQGYWPESLLTPPSDEAIQKDIELTKAMGFNGVRKHQKVEDPRYLYWADKLGLVVWGEMANAYHFSDEYVGRVTREWLEIIDRDYNHPCIVAWVPVNESWGTPRLPTNERERQHLLANYHLLKSLDGTRPVVSNDGWEHARTDLLTIHDYSPKRQMLLERYDIDPAETAKLLPAGRVLYVPGQEYRGEPMLITEFGGIAFKTGSQEGWGYSGAADADDFARRYAEVVEALFDCSNVVGWCYTQLTDVEQEINGLLTYDRQPKLPVEVIRKINRG